MLTLQHYYQVSPSLLYVSNNFIWQLLIITQYPTGTFNVSTALYCRSQISGGGSLVVGTPEAMADTAHFNGTIKTLSNVQVFSKSVVIPSGKFVLLNASVSEAGPGQGNYSVNTGGGGHGGSGGANSDGISGKPYGSYAYPSLSGSRGAAVSGTRIALTT